MINCKNHPSIPDKPCTSERRCDHCIAKDHLSRLLVICRRLIDEDDRLERQALINEWSEIRKDVYRKTM